MARDAPRLALVGPPEGGVPRLAEGEAAHALRVLRLGAGDRCVGLDGSGGAWPLVVERADRRELRLAVAGEPEREPAPGEPDAPLPWIEVAVAWPRRARADEMVGRLVQLGAAAITPLVARLSGPQTAPAPDDGRVARLVRAACKQSGRLWPPRLGAPTSVLALVRERPDAPVAILDPREGMALDTWARSLRPGPDGAGTEARPVVLAIGPEGGFAPEEREGLLLAGATTARVGPHVLRVETAAEAALAVVAAALSR